MSALPPDYQDGNILPAAPLNQQLAARYGDILPIDPTTRNTNDGVQNIGSATKRFKDGHYSGKVNADGQNRLRARPIAQSPTGGIENPTSWASPLFNIGTAISPSGAVDFILNEAGIYLVISSIQLGGTFNIRLKHERPVGTVIDQWQVNVAATLGTLSNLVFAQAGDVINQTLQPNVTAALTITYSDINIVRLY